MKLLIKDDFLITCYGVSNYFEKSEKQNCTYDKLIGIHERCDLYFNYKLGPLHEI